MGSRVERNNDDMLGDVGEGLHGLARPGEGRKFPLQWCPKPKP